MRCTRLLLMQANVHICTYRSAVGLTTYLAFNILSKMPNPFVHQPLARPSHDIRLLQILPGRRSDPIYCTSSVAQRRSNPSYCAVSYTWGNANEIETIFVDGHLLTVRHNCFFALWQLRFHKIDLAVWIDSVCIDQENNEEKSCQVRLMGSIYARAEITMACLGASSQIRDVVDDIELFNIDDIVDSHLHRAWQNLSTLANDPYFSRLWIVQELYHSKKIALLCGEEILVWQDLQTHFLQIVPFASQIISNESHSDASQDLNTTILARFIHFRRFRLAQLDLKVEWTDEITGHGFTGVLLSFGEGLCADPRDKIYGLLSLAQDSRWLVHFPIDYNRPLIDVLRDVVCRVGRESLTENTSRLIANMLRWFNITADSVAGQTVLRSTQQRTLEQWGDFSHNEISFESVRAWQVVNPPMQKAEICNTDFVPHTKNLLMYFNGFSVQRESSFARLKWRQVCLARGLLIKSSSENCWIAGPDTRPGDFLVEFHAMRDEADEYSTVVVCRPPDRKVNRMEIVNQATLLVSLEDYDRAFHTEFHRKYPSENLSEPETRYLISRTLFAWPSEDRFEVNLKPFDLINSVMTRGDVLTRLQFPILSETSGCHVDRIDVDKAELQSRTYTITM
ncbi:heterokaryon incompatibility protein-domain-containing protein [Paraphoma chrysanthemicola]|nr:heterokaryon incompatibility protein-domain-containing protein [Paraphoma chrysanthemicola]